MAVLIKVKEMSVSEVQYSPYTEQGDASMNLSGILVITQPQWLEQVSASLEALDGVEVHVKEPEKGRLIVVQEATDVHAEIDGLKRIKALPHVVMAEMVYHYFAEDDRVYDGLPSELAEESTECVPAYLNT